MRSKYISLLLLLKLEGYIVQQELEQNLYVYAQHFAWHGCCYWYCSSQESKLLRLIKYLLCLNTLNNKGIFLPLSNGCFTLATEGSYIKPVSFKTAICCYSYRREERRDARALWLEGKTRREKGIKFAWHCNNTTDRFFLPCKEPSTQKHSFISWQFPVARKLHEHIMYSCF